MRKPQKPIEEMTTRELKKFIRKEVKKANTRLKNIYKRKRGASKAVQQEIDYLKRFGIINKRGKAITGYRTARKPELQKRARELEYFNQWKGAEKRPVALEKDYKKYETFVQNNPDFAGYSYQDWKDLVNVFGSMSDKLKDFGYEDMKQLHLEATEKRSKVDFLGAMQKVQNESTGAGLTQEDLVDFMRSELFNAALR